MEAKNYNIEREKCIGRGTFGKVYLCFDKNDRQKKFAMKVIDLECSSEDKRNLAEKEANLLTTLQHKYILRALTTFQENETLCIVTEFCDQGNLEQFLKERKEKLLEERQIVKWFRQICSALQYLHGRNILHRDIKTQNIFLTGKEMTIKLGDLGEAKVLESSIQKTSTFCGTPHYISPEILHYQPYNSKSDIWAMGVCVYEMTTLRRPFDARLLQQLFLKIANDQLPPLPEGYSSELNEIIERMMCREPDRRPSASELLQDALFKNNSTSKVQHFLPIERTTCGNLSTYEDMEKTISDTTFKMYINANREYDNYPSCTSTVSNTESFEASTSDKANGSETSLEHENYLENTITAGKIRSTSLPPSCTFTIIRSLFTSLKSSVMEGSAGPDGRNSISSRPKRDKEIDIVQELKEDCIHEDKKRTSGISEENWHPPSYTDRQDSEAVLQQEFEEFKVGKDDEKDDEEKRLMDEKVKRRSQSKENNRKPENVGYGRPRSGRPRPGLDRPYGGHERQSNDRKYKERRQHAQNNWVEYKPGEKNSVEQNVRGMKKDDRKHKDKEKKFWDRGLPDERDKYEYFWGNRSVFSQWYPCKFEVDGKPYNCTEQYMMHPKAVLMDDMERADIIMALDDPREMMQQGRYVENFDKKIWDKCCQDVVEKGNVGKFAMKKINLSKLSKSDRSSAETEARLLTSLQNEYILHVVTAFQERETLCIVTEFFDQGNLAQFLEGRKGESLDEQRIVEWFRQICCALEYLHRRNVLHRNIKTQNIFLTGKEMTAKLGNFGLAKVLESSNHEDLSVRGSPYYMNPDVFAQIQYNSKTDIWAFGVCVYEMVVLRLPVDVPEIQQLVLDITHDKLPPLPEGYSPELNEIIEWMMCRETDRRPSALELLKNVLFKNHVASKVPFLPDEKTTRKKISTNEDIDKIIRDTTMIINCNVNRENDSYLPSRSTVSNSESFETRTSNTELSKASGSKTSLEDSYEKNFEKTMTADQAGFTFQNPVSFTFTKIRSLFGCFKRSLMIGGAGSSEKYTATELEEFQRNENGRQPNERKNTDKKSIHSDWKGYNTAENVERPKHQKRFWDKGLPNEKHLYEYFWKSDSVFSQWYPCKFTVDEITYTSAEQYMMHQKAVLMDDKESADIILALHEPNEMNKIGRHVQNFNQELWKSYCLKVVEKGNLAKFSQNEELRTYLFNTYPKTLVEASPIDTIWGIGLSEKDKRAWNKETWRGQNLLGEILTKVRDKLLELESFLEPVVPGDRERSTETK